MNDAEHVFDWLQGWYAAQCNEDWEHEWGVKIDTLDNPGWSVRIDLEETDLEGHDYPRQDLKRSGNDWVMAWTSGMTFHAACGPGNLSEALRLFRSWAVENAPNEQQDGPASIPPAPDTAPPGEPVRSDHQPGAVSTCQ
ncbi:immunity 53 family protein [Peterkaempfera sp. SMS 1(5)a]|uniref:immunity 53 family protein n=1 Tax=Peterkaempfera podocarpi TaxID=3232308 RepID=UPI00367047D4